MRVNYHNRFHLSRLVNPSNGMINAKAFVCATCVGRKATKIKMISVFVESGCNVPVKVYYLHNSMLRKERRNNHIDKFKENDVCS